MGPGTLPPEYFRYLVLKSVNFIDIGTAEVNSFGYCSIALSTTVSLDTVGLSNSSVRRCSPDASSFNADIRSAADAEVEYGCS